MSFDAADFLDAKGNLWVKPKSRRVEWRISAYAVIPYDGKILMVIPTWNHQWELPGGGIEIKESIEEGLIRECLEETGYQVKITNHLPFYFGEEKFFCRAENKYHHSLVLVYYARLKNSVQNNTMVNRNEIKEVGWKNHQYIKKKDCHPIIWPTIDYLKSWIHIKFD